MIAILTNKYVKFIPLNLRTTDKYNPYCKGNNFKTVRKTGMQQGRLLLPWYAKISVKICLPCFINKNCYMYVEKNILELHVV